VLKRQGQGRLAYHHFGKGAGPSEATSYETRLRGKAERQEVLVNSESHSMDKALVLTIFQFSVEE
jgi:hypothetical protein